MTSPSSCAWPISRQMPTSAASTTRSTKCTSEPARDSSFGITSTRDPHAKRFGHGGKFLDAPPGGVAAVVGRGRRRPSRHTQVRDEHLERNPTRDLQRSLGFPHGPRPGVAVRARQRQRRRPPSRRKTFADRSVHAMQFHAGFGQPLLQVSDGHFAVVVEVGPGCEYLDRTKPKRRRSR